MADIIINTIEEPQHNQDYKEVTNISGVSYLHGAEADGTPVKITPENAVGSGTYSKPSTGIPKSDLESAVQTSLGKANTAVQPVSGSSLVPDIKIKSYDSHISNKSNPHGVTKTQVGLGNVDNTSDADKPLSTAQKAAIDKVQENLDALGLKVDNGCICMEA